MSSEPALVDTNALVYALYKDSEHHGACRALLDAAQARDAALCVSPQNLAEFYATVTNPRRVAVPRSPEDALSAAEQILFMPGMTLLSVPTDVVARWMELARRRPVAGSRVFDLQLIATMLANGVSRIYTYNRSDFEPFEEIEVLTP